MTNLSAPALDRTGFADLLARFYSRLDAEEMLYEALTRDLKDRVALVSSFGAESVALIHLVAKVAADTPVIFLDTEMLFPETLAYQARLARELGLTDMRIIRPDPGAAQLDDPARTLHQRDTDACCHLRKVAPLARALDGFDGWITGRKRFQGATRAALSPVEVDEAGRLKLNPLADWDAQRIRAYMKTHDLPPHPLVAQGYPSIGCAPCTSRAAPGEDPRAGRWRGEAKAECGIHFVDGKPVRGNQPTV
ncbi:MAG: phosphoadenylyl-sulfate reductase [Pseudomonadota bacterium]